MFSTLGLFSQIRCPGDNRCLLPNCLFLHKKAEVAVNGSSSASSTSVGTPQDISADGENAASRKRRKLESTTSSAGVSSTPASNAHSRPSKQRSPVASVQPSATKAPVQEQRKPNAEIPPLQTARKPVSPPPSRRQPTATSQASQNGVSSDAAPSTSTKIQRKIGHGRGPAIETLNPRLLQMPPATHSLRRILVTRIHEQLVRLNNEGAESPKDFPKALLLSEQELIVMALDEEETIAIQNRVVYSNVIKNRLMRFTRMKLEEWKEIVSKRKGLVTEDQGLKPESPRLIETGLTVQEELIVLQRLKAPLTGLSQYGYVTTAPTEAEVEQARKGLETAAGWETCDRCKTRFQVFPGRREDGSLTAGGKCTYHWGKRFTQQRNPYDMSKPEKRYTCCNQPVGESSGCTKADCHVVKAGEAKRMASVLQFETTPANPNAPTDRAVCVDCEMCYTTYGLELVRLTATAWPKGEEIVDVLVRPMGEILDLNTRFSGITSQQLANAQPYQEGAEQGPTESTSSLRIVSSPSAARELLFKHIGPETPIVGHALENDFAAARIIHPYFVDSALLFPHRLRLPYRNSLKTLMKIHLNRNIQMTSDNKLGHDSKEDARAAGDLVRWAVGNEWMKLKREGWKIEDGELIAPGKASMPTPAVSAVGKGKKRAREDDGEDVERG
ncbi:MAG: RNA exonuclease 3 [Peltula sp. TS41687]|nr:MAG: RNA exonuclease 3 [Peltula sp. TS41687]